MNFLEPGDWSDLRPVLVGPHRRYHRAFPHDVVSGVAEQPVRAAAQRSHRAHPRTCPPGVASNGHVRFQRDGGHRRSLRDDVRRAAGDGSVRIW